MYTPHPPGQRTRGSGRWLRRPNPVKWVAGRSGVGLQWLRLGGRGRKEGTEFKNVESEGWFSFLHLTAEAWVRAVRPNCHPAGGRARRQGRHPWPEPSRRVNPAPPPSRRVCAGRATRRRVLHPSTVALSSSPSRWAAPTPGPRSSRTRSGPGRALAARARGAARARAPAMSAPPRR